MEKRYLTSEMSSPSVVNSTGTAVVSGVQFYFAQHLHHLRITVVEEEALLSVQRGDGGYVFGTQLEVEDVEILDDPFLPH